MKTLMENLKAKLATVPLVKYVDEDWGQIDFALNPPVKWPCVLINLQSGTFSDVGRQRDALSANRQMGEILVELRIANLKLTNSSQRATPQQKVESLSVLQVMEDVQNTIHGWSPGSDSSGTNFNGKLIRERFRNERRNDGIQEYSVIYSISVTSA